MGRKKEYIRVRIRDLESMIAWAKAMGMDIRLETYFWTQLDHNRIAKLAEDRSKRATKETYEDCDHGYSSEEICPLCEDEAKFAEEQNNS